MSKIKVKMNNRLSVRSDNPGFHGPEGENITLEKIKKAGGKLSVEKTAFVEGLISCGSLLHVGNDVPAEEPKVKIKFKEVHKIGKTEYTVDQEAEFKADYANKLVEAGKAELV